MTIMSDAIYATQGLTFMGGHDADGKLYILWGPTLREVFCIMVRLEGTWVPYKMYKNNRSKTKKRAEQHLKHYRKKYPNAQFNLDEIWESVPVNEMEKTYYEGEEEILSDIAETLGVGLDRFAVGLGRADRTGLIMVGDTISGQVERVLWTATPEIGPFQFNVARLPDPDREQHSDNGFGRPTVGDIVPEEIEQSPDTGDGRDGDREERAGETQGDSGEPQVHDIGTEPVVPDTGMHNGPEADAELGLETME